MWNVCSCGNTAPRWLLNSVAGDPKYLESELRSKISSLPPFRWAGLPILSWDRRASMDVSLKCEAASEEAQLSSACPSQDDVAGGCEQAIGPDACIVQPTETPASLILFGSTAQETPWEARPIGHVLYGYSRRHVRGSQRSSDHSSFIILWLRSVRARSLKHLQNLSSA